MSDEYDCEPVPGLPQNLPEGEALIWQGSPSPTGVAQRVLQTRAVGFYFALLAAVPLVTALASGASLTSAIGTTLRVAIAGAIAIAILTVLSRLIARTTIYSLTSKRIVMRYGVAFPMTVNIPFNEIASVDCKTYADGSSDIALATSGPLRLSYLHLWPHARSWRFEKAEPTLRVVPDGAAVAKSLAEAMLAAGMQGAAARSRQSVGASSNSQGVPNLASATA
ncbi:MAG: PH domain-containing protein [Hyphomicrobium sp.]|nr:PH domain-containing protein [Hyphomicrobium sp.]